MEMPINRYIVITANSLFDLEYVVKAHLLARWIPQGGVALSKDGSYAQAMIKYLCNHTIEMIGDEWRCTKCGEKHE